MRLPLRAAILASFAMAMTPAFAQQEGSTSGSGSAGGSFGHHAQGPTHLPPPKSKPKSKTSQPAQAEQAQPVQAAAPAAAAPAAATVMIDASSTYNDALKCYQFHGVAMQIAKAMEGRANIAEGQKAQYESVAKMSGYLQAKWFQRLGELNTTKKTPAELNADLQSIAGSVVVDANAGLGGDKDAQARNDALKTQCKTFEKIQTQTAAPATSATPPG